MIPLGATVRWRDTIYKSAWSGVVTGHPRAKMVEVDGRGAISEGLLEVVEMDAGTTEEARREIEARISGYSEMVMEVAGLTEIVAQQCELIASMTADASEIKRLQEVEDDFQRLRDAVSDALLALTGARRPTGMDLLQTDVAEISALVEEMERAELPNRD
jgi:hypothetical protein